MFKFIAIGIGALVAAVLAFAATRPDTFRVERSIQVAASPADVQALVDDFRQWRLWSPWENLDPEMQRAFHGSESGPGAVYEWDGNRQAGAGSMEIVESVAAERTEIALTFLRPFKAANTVEFTFVPSNGGTRVNWTMHGPAGYMSKLMTVFASFDKMIGPDFERGLQALKVEAEKRS